MKELPDLNPKELPDLNPKLIINKMIDAIGEDNNKYAVKAKAHELIDHMKKKRAAQNHKF